MKVRHKCSKTNAFNHKVDVHVEKLDRSYALYQLCLTILPCTGRTKACCSILLMDHHWPKASLWTDFVLSCIKRASINGSLCSGHSFRIGAASTVAANGVENSFIQTLGWWKARHTLPMFAYPQKILLPFLYWYVIAIKRIYHPEMMSRYKILSCTTYMIVSYIFVPWANIWYM